MNKITAHLAAGLCAVGLSAGLVAGSAQAALIASESFDTGVGGYTVGESLADASGNPTGLTGDWTLFAGSVTPTIYQRITGTGLTHPGTNASGGAVENYQGASGSDLVYSTLFSNAPVIGSGTDVYFSALVNVNSGVAGGLIVKFAGKDGFGVSIDKSGHGSVFRQITAGTRDPVITSQTYTAATTYLIVGKMVGGTGADKESIQLVGVYGASDSLVEPVTPLASLTYDVYGTTTAQQTLEIAGVLIGKGGIGTGTVDELRVGTTFADVTVPEPGSLTLLAGAAGGLLLRRRKRLAAV